MSSLATAELTKFLNRPGYLVHPFNKGGAADDDDAKKLLLTCLETKRVSHSSYAKRGMRRLLAVALICVTTLMLVLYQVYVQPERVFISAELKGNETPLILVWTPFFSDKVWIPKTLDGLGCKVSQCKTTYDRASLWSSSVVVFHWRNVNLDDLPKTRPYSQLWALFNKESPPHTPRHILNALSNQINWTITYRRDSDFWAPYGKIVVGGTNETQRRVAKKSLVAWLVSNCNTEGHRENYVQELGRHISVDVYGKCGKTYCTQVSASECYKKLGRKYKFYLSFENSICRDYATEKLYYAMINGMIPVVFGDGAYSDLLPPNSYVDALNFTSPEELANFLTSVANDTSKYESYFEWNKYYSVKPASYDWLCEMCEKLHDENLEIPSRDLLQWWYGESQCSTWKDGKILPI